MVVLVAMPFRFTGPFSGRPQVDLLSSRHDLVRLCAVEIAILLKDARGTRIAAEFLSRHGVDIHVALRVLLHPDQRRQRAG